MSPVNRALYSSATVEWSTPQDFYDRLDAEFGFTLDVAADKTNAKCAHYFTEHSDGLQQTWKTPGAVWMNPPYGRTIGAWMRKALEESRRGATVVCLVPARTDTRWWHETVIAGGAEVRFVRGRLRFGGAKNSAPFPSAVVVFRPTGQLTVAN